MFEIERVEADLREVVAGLDPACLEGRDAAKLTEVSEPEPEGDRVLHHDGVGDGRRDPLGCHAPPGVGDPIQALAALCVGRRP